MCQCWHPVPWRNTSSIIRSNISNVCIVICIFSCLSLMWVLNSEINCDCHLGPHPLHWAGVPCILQFYWNCLKFNNFQYNQSPGPEQPSFQRMWVCLCYLSLPNCVDWNKILWEYKAGQHSKCDKHIHPRMHSDPSQCQHLKSTCSHLLQADEMTAPVSCQNAPCIPHSSA